MKNLHLHINNTGIKLIRHFQEHVYFELNIVKPRKTKLGDYRFTPSTGKHEITINGDLKNDAFLYTTLHEIAHQHTQIKYGRSVQAHGNEWKDAYKKLLLLALKHNAFINPNLIVKSLENIGYSSSTNQEIFKELYSDKKEGEIFLEELHLGATFIFKNKTYQKKKHNTKRSICTHLKDGKDYFISNVAPVTLV